MVGEGGVEFFGLGVDVAVVRIKPGKLVAAFEVAGAEAAFGGPTEGGGGHEFVAAGEVEDAFGEGELALALEVVEVLFDCLEVVVGYADEAGVAAGD